MAMLYLAQQTKLFWGTWRAQVVHFIQVIIETLEGPLATKTLKVHAKPSIQIRHLLHFNQLSKK